MRKNPYLYKALGIERASEIVQRLLDDHLSSSDEGIFGDAFFEPIALIASGGIKGPSAGIDIIIDNPGAYKAIAVKSGPNPFNASQKRRQNDEFNDLKRRLHNLQKIFDPLLGHAYGRRVSSPTRTKVYRESSGQAFWEELTGDPDFYIKLITLMKEEPLKYRDQFKSEWDASNNKFSLEFSEGFCLEDGHVDWEKWVKLVSAKEKPKRVSKMRKQKPRS